MQSTIKLGSCLASGAFLPAPHPRTLIQQQCGRHLQEADATCAQSNAFQAHVITSRTFIGTGIHATMCDLHISQRMTAPSPASTHSRSAQPGAIAGTRLLTLSCAASHAHEISGIKRIQPSESKEGDSSLRLSKTRCQHRRPLRTQPVVANGAEAVSLSLRDLSGVLNDAIDSLTWQ